MVSSGTITARLRVGPHLPTRTPRLLVGAIYISFPDCDYTVSMADGYRRVQETVKAFERKMASEIARLVAEETRPLRAALEASKLECEALRNARPSWRRA